MPLVARRHHLARPGRRRAGRAALAAALAATGLLVPQLPPVTGLAAGAPAGTVVGTAVGAPPASRAASVAESGPVRWRTIPTRVFVVPGLGRIAVGAPSLRRVMIQHQDRASGTWLEPEVLHREPGLECGDLEGRVSAGGVALLLECDSGYAEDQAPARSVALISGDLRRWERTTLPGEAYRAPGISPDGGHAVWLAGGHGDVVSWSAGDGFSARRSTGYDHDDGDPTAVIADDGTVSVLGAEPAPDDGRCVVGVHTLSIAGERSSTVVDPAPGHRIGCTELSLDGLSSTRVEGRFWSPADTFVLGRDDEASAWRLLEPPPSLAPGLVEHDGPRRRTMHTVFSWSRTGPMAAVGSPDRQQLEVQLYDSAAQRWGPPEVVYDHGFPGCTWGGFAGNVRLGVHQLVMHCYPRERADGDYPPRTGWQPAPRRHTRALLSPDGDTWVVVPLGRRPLGVRAGGTPVAAPQPRRTTVVSPAGVVRLPAGVSGPCDVVFPTSSSTVVRLHAGRGDRGWPARLQAHDGERWHTVGRVPMPARGRCLAPGAATGETPTRFMFRGEHRRWVFVRVVPAGDGWRAVRTRGY